jgi:hypothetical protein
MVGRVLSNGFPDGFVAVLQEQVYDTLIREFVIQISFLLGATAFLLGFGPDRLTSCFAAPRNISVLRGQ